MDARANLVTILFVSTLIATLISTPSLSRTQEWPARQPIRVLVALTPGSATDLVSRLVFEQVGKQIGQIVVIENRAGASQTTAASAVAKAERDGYTILAAGSALAVVPSTMTKLTVGLQTDLTAVGLLADVPLVMVVNPGKGYKNIQDFVFAAKKAARGTMTYGSGGHGDSTHLAAERSRVAAGVEGLYVLFRGSPEVLNEVMAGRLEFYMSPAAPAMSLIAGRKVQALAVASATRAITLPDVPTTTEAGFVHSDYEFWVDAFAPTGMPRTLVDRLNQEIVKPIETPQVRERLESIGVSASPLSAQAFADQFKREIAIDAALVKAAGLEAN